MKPVGVEFQIEQGHTVRRNTGANALLDLYGVIDLAVELYWKRRIRKLVSKAFELGVQNNIEKGPYVVLPKARAADYMAQLAPEDDANPFADMAIGAENKPKAAKKPHKTLKRIPGQSNPSQGIPSPQR